MYKDREGTSTHVQRKHVPSTGVAGEGELVRERKMVKGGSERESRAEANRKGEGIIEEIMSIVRR